MNEKRLTTSSNRSLLVADLGRCNTSVAYFDIVAGKWRFIARGVSLTTNGPPWHDVSLGLKQAIKQISEITGRVFLDGEDELIKPSDGGQRGTDFFGLSVSAAEPLRAILIDLDRDGAVSDPGAALRSVYGIEVENFSAAIEGDGTEILESLLQNRPEIVLISASEDGRKADNFDEVMVALNFAIESRDASWQPVVYVTAPPDIQSYIRKKFGSIESIYPMPSLPLGKLPSLADTCTHILREEYLKNGLHKLSGFEKICKWLAGDPQLTAHNFAEGCRLRASSSKSDVLGVDVGCDSVTLVRANPEWNGLFVKAGLTSGISWEEQVDIESNFGAAMSKKSFWPGAIPTNREETLLDLGISRQLIEQAVAEAVNEGRGSLKMALNEVNEVILSGGPFLNSLSADWLLTFVKEVLKPVGSVSVLIDKFGLIPAAGLIGDENAETAAQILEDPTVEDPKWVFEAALFDQSSELVVLEEAEGFPTFA